MNKQTIFLQGSAHPMDSQALFWKESNNNN